MNYESVDRLPYGLIVLEVNGVQQHIARVSPKDMLVRAMQPVQAAMPLRVSFYRPESASYDHMHICEYRVESVRRQDGAVLTRLSFLENGEYAANVRRTLDAYARYVQLRSEYGASAYGCALGLYPLEADAEFYDSAEDQCGAWYAELLRNGPFLPPRGGRETAIAMDAPHMYELYLQAPQAGFLRAYAASKGMPEELLSGCMPDRLYIGNAYCDQLFPEPATLQRILEKAEAEGISVTVVTANLRQGAIAQAEKMLAHLPENTELVFNDWGMLMLLQAHRDRLEPVLGTRLNVRRKDPRVRYRAGVEKQLQFLQENALNGGEYRDFLRAYGVRRFEYESCGVPIRIPQGRHSVHFPFYQTNTSMYCPLRAYCETGDRGRQGSDASCSGYCRENVFLYPKHLKMMGRLNSLFALDVCADREWLYNFDRWVLNF